MKRILLIGLVFFLGKFIQAQNLDQDSWAIKNLTNNEISAYQSLLTFTESQIGCNSSGQYKEKCWKRFLDSKFFNRTTGRIRLPWSLKAQNSFIGKLNLEEVTDSIWIKSWSWNPVTQDTVDYYYLDFYGSLGTLYSAAARSNETWKEIWQHIQSTGEIGPSLHAGLFHPEINKLLYDPKMRLLLSLELMRLNKN